MKHVHVLHIRFIAAAFVATLLNCHSLTNHLLARESGWTVVGSEVDWFGTAPWTNGVPNTAGDVAVLTTTSSPATAGLSAPSTIGQLRFNGSSNLALAGSGSLVFDSAGLGPARIVGDSARRPITADIAVPVSVAAGQELHFDVNNVSTLRLTGGLSLAGTARKLGAGHLILPTASPAWTGEVVVEAGDVSIEHTQALANLSKLTIESGARLTIVSQDTTPESSRDPYIIPRITLDGGTLQTNLGASQVVTLLNSDCELVSNSVIQVPSKDYLYLKGNIAGPGGVTFQERFDSAANQNALGWTYLSIDGETSYQGETVIGPNIWVHFRKSAALGDNQLGTRVTRGALELTQGGGSETISVEQGYVRLNGASVPYGHRIHLDGSQLSGGEVPPAVLGADLEYTRGAMLGTESGGDNLIITGAVVGTGSLAIQNEVEIQGGLDVRGHLYVRNRAGAKLSGPVDLAGDVFIDRWSLDVQDNIGAEQNRFRVVSTFEVADARLTFSSSNTVRSILLDPRQANREGTFQRSVVEAASGAVLTVADELRFLGGTLRGRFAGQQVLRKQDRAVGVLENIADSDFHRIEVEAGQLVVSGNAGATAPAIHLENHDTSRVMLSETGSYSGDIHLNNARGYQTEAALTFHGNSTLDGDLFLGPEGASIAGGSAVGSGLSPNSSIHGGDLWTKGRGEVRIRGGNHTYSGATYVNSENLVLVDGGRLNSTSAVVGAGRFSNVGGRGSLVLDNSGAMAMNDRIPDNTPVQLHGMTLTLKGRTNEAVSETLGRVSADRGISELIIDDPFDSANTELRVGELDRQAGSLVKFTRNSNSGKFLFENAPSLDDGLLGAWAIVDGDEFATYGPNGVVPYSDLYSYATDLGTATAADNVRPSSARPALTSSKTVNSLSTSDHVINLNGHTLTVDSGGMISRLHFQTTIEGAGALTAGASGELLISGNYRIASDIVDNPQEPVGLTHTLSGSSSSAYLVLSGNNSYTGPTVINSANSIAVIDVARAGALPAGGDVILNGGMLQFSYNAGAPIPIGHLEVRDTGSVRSGSGFNSQIQPESVLIESGYLGVDIVGDAPITKRGSELAEISTSLAVHTGKITIEEGVFSLEALGTAPLDDAHAVTVEKRGILLANSDFALAGRKIRLDGGALDLALRGRVTAPIEVLAAGGAIRNGRGESIIASPIAGSGALALEGGLGNGILQFGSDLSNFEGSLRFTGGAISVTTNLKYDGLIDVTTADLTAVAGTPFGTSTVVLHPESQLSLGGKTTANLLLNGGVLKLQSDDNRTSPVLNGTLAVSNHSYLYIAPGFDGFTNHPKVQSDLQFGDQSNLVITPSPERTTPVGNGLFPDRLSINSNMTISGTTTITSFDNAIEIAGTISPATDEAVLRLVGNDTFTLRAAVELGNGKSLTVLEDDLPATISLSGQNSRLAGNGTLTSNMNIGTSATISPGQSPGELRIRGDVAIGEAAVFSWDVDDSHGTAGADWDLLRVDGNLTFKATDFEPWIFRLDSVPSSRNWNNEPLLIVAAESITAFDPSTYYIDASAMRANHPEFAGLQFSLISDGKNLFLHTVPEPSAISLVIVAMVSASTRLWSQLSRASRA